MNMPGQAEITEKTFSCQRGFSLIELSIVLIILGVLAVPLINAYEAYKSEHAFLKNQSAMEATAVGIASYYAKNGAYPCPADPALAVTDAAGGNESRVAGNCVITGDIRVGPGTDFLSTGTATDWDFDGNPDRVLIGSVPFKTIEVSLLDSIDSYGNKVMYAVSENMTQSGSDNRGSIQVWIYDAGTDTVSGSVGIRLDSASVPINDVTPVDGLPDEGARHYVLFTTGANGLGGYTRDGVALGACTPDANQSGDDENCDGDGDFLRSGHTDIAGPRYYDDLITDSSQNFSNLWAIDLDTDSMYNTNFGNVGVGTDTPLEKLHVAGNLKASKVYSQELCDDSDNCFLPEAIGGNLDPNGDNDYSDRTGGMECGGQVMIGISEGRELCDDIKINITAGTCPDGQYVSGIAADGSIICK